MNDQITITGSPTDLAEFLNSLTDDVQVNLLIEPEGDDADGTEETYG